MANAQLITNNITDDDDNNAQYINNSKPFFCCMPIWRLIIGSGNAGRQASGADRQILLASASEDKHEEELFESNYAYTDNSNVDKSLNISSSSLVSPPRKKTIKAGSDLISQSLSKPLLLLIFSYLPLLDICNLSAVNKYFNSLTNQQLLWVNLFVKKWGMGWYNFALKKKGAASWKAVYRRYHILNTRYQLLAKILVLGVGGTGKSSIIKRFTSHKFEEDIKSTFAVEFSSRACALHQTFVKTQIWDAGSRYYARAKEKICQKADGIMIVFDITQQASFTAIPSFLNDVKEFCKPDTPLVLVSTKLDLQDKRQFAEEEIEAFASEHKLNHIAVSSKTGENVERAFSTLISDVIKRWKEKNSKKEAEEE